MPRYNAKFVGREVGAIGIGYPIETTLNATDKETAELALYDRWEHIQRLELKEERKLTEFQRDYLVSLLWSNTGDDDRPLDDDYGPDDVNLEDDATWQHLESVQGFYDRFQGIWEGYWKTPSAAHDLALTRNRHGAGFWDRYSEGEGEVRGRILTKWAHVEGSADPYVGDDGKVYIP